LRRTVLWRYCQTVACGAFGCAEAEAAGWSLPCIVNDWPGTSDSTFSEFQHIGCKQLFEQNAHENPAAMTIRDRHVNI
jgi:hypothetical protein